MKDETGIDQKLNGAQIGSLISVVQQVSAGTISRNAAISLVTATLGVSREAAETFIEDRVV